MAYEPKYLDIGGALPDNLEEALTKFVDENVCEAIVQFLDGVVADATINGKGIWLIDTDFSDRENWCISVKEVVERTIEQYSEGYDEESRVECLRGARKHLREALAMLDKVL